MLLTIATNHTPATDLGYLLHKHPDRVHTSRLSFGSAHVFFPEATEARAEAALLVEVDPVALSRRPRGAAAGPLEPYVNDRPYAASSFLSVALRDVFGTAMAGRSKDRPALADAALPFTATLTALRCRGGEAGVRALFEPLGYAVETRALPLDPDFPEWGDAPHLDLTLRGEVRLRDLLAHLYVLVPVLDGNKHYFVDEAELDKLQRHGGAWLDAHPERELIAARFLRYKKALTRAATAGFTPLPPQDDVPEAEEGADDAPEETALQETAPRVSLHARRLDAAVNALLASGARRVLDLGCGEGRLLAKLAEHRQFEQVLGVDVSVRALARAREKLSRLPETRRERIELAQGALTYRDTRLRGWDAAALVEVVEHLDEARLGALELAVFGDARPGTVIVTTPNVEYNARFETLEAGTFRHADHRFEWTRAQFRAWAGGVAERRGYTVAFEGVGDEDPEVGPPSQMGVFTRAS